VSDRNLTVKRITDGQVIYFGPNGPENS